MIAIMKNVFSAQYRTRVCGRVCVSAADSVAADVDADALSRAALHLARSFFFLPIISFFPPFLLTVICLASISIILIWHILAGLKKQTKEGK